MAASLLFSSGIPYSIFLYIRHFSSFHTSFILLFFFVLLPSVLFLTFNLSPSFFSWLPLTTTLVGFVISAVDTGSDSTWPASHWLTDATSEFEIRWAWSYLVEVFLRYCNSVRVSLTWRKYHTVNTLWRKCKLSPLNLCLLHYIESTLHEEHV